MVKRPINRKGGSIAQHISAPKNPSAANRFLIAVGQRRLHQELCQNSYQRSKPNRPQKKVYLPLLIVLYRKKNCSFFSSFYNMSIQKLILRPPCQIVDHFSFPKFINITMHLDTYYTPYISRSRCIRKNYTLEKKIKTTLIWKRESKPYQPPP